MRTTKNWGLVSSGAELYMLNRAERHRKELEREEKRHKFKSECYKRKH